MRFLANIFIAAFFIYGTAAQSNVWNNLQPLRSTRADVEKLLGKPREQTTFGDTYTYGNDQVTVRYSAPRCDNGWDVGKDIVLEIEVSSAEKSNKTAKELGYDSEKYFVSIDDAFYANWTDPIAGITHYFGRVDEEYIYTEYIPRRADNDLRCDGFPPFAPEASNYLKLEDFLLYNPSLGQKESVLRARSRIDTLIAERENRLNGKFKAYIVVYFDDKLPYGRYKRYLREIHDHLFKLRKVSPSDFGVIEGGMRHETKVEFYLLMRDVPAPAPDPTLPSPQFMRKKK